MANTIKIKNSGTASNVPSAASLQFGELALNYADGKLYFKTGASTVDFLKSNITLGTDTTGDYVSSLVAGTGITLTNNSGEGATPTITVQTLNQNTTGTAATVTGAAQTAITSVGTLTGLTIGGAGADRKITIDAPTGYTPIQHFAINSVNKWHIQSSTSGLQWSVVETGVAERLGITNTGATFSGTITATSYTGALASAVTATTQTAADSTTKVATTAFVTTADNLKANLASPTFTGTPLSTTAAVDTNTTQIATTAYVVGQGYAKLASPTFTGTVTVPTPTNSTDAVTKAYADAITQSLDIKDSVRVASTVNIAVASALTNTSTIDGVVVATGDRVLLKNQTAGAENGIYVVVASGAASRSTDANTSAKVTSGMYVFVSEGTVSADMGYVLTTNDAITLGTTSLSFTQFSGAGQITAGTGLSKSGNTLSVNAAQTGITSVGTLGSLTVTGNLTVDTDTLFVDATNNRVSIGSKAKIGTYYSTAYMAYNSYFENIGGDGYVYDSNAAVSAISLQSDSIRFWTGTGGTAGTTVYSGEKMRLTTEGNLGIGTTSPATKLDVVGTATVRAAATQDGVALAGRAGGTSTYEVTLTPTALTADRTLTLPDASGTVAFTDSAMTSSTFIGTTSVALNRSSGALTLAGITLTTPVLGVASATTVNKVAFTAPATGSTLTIAEGKTLTASNTLTLTGTDASSVAFGTGGTVAYTNVATLSSLISVGTIGTGVWQGTAIAGQYGGTGVANTGKTITLGGNLTTSGAFTTTLTATANTSVTLPTSGTLTTTGKAIAMAIVFGS